MYSQVSITFSLDIKLLIVPFVLIIHSIYDLVFSEVNSIPYPTSLFYSS